MKRFVITLLLCVVPLATFAQLNVQEHKYAEKVLGLVKEGSTIPNSRYISRIYITRQGTTYYLCREDYEHQNHSSIDIPIRGTQFAFCLGKTKSSSLKTAQDMYDICVSSEPGTSLIVKDADGEKATIFKDATYRDAEGHLFIESTHPDAKPSIRITIGDGPGGRLYPFILEKGELQKAISIIKNG